MGLVQGDGDYYVARNGSANVPTTGNANADMLTNEGAEHAVYRPEFAFLYLGGVNALSVVSATTGRIVQLLFWKGENWPRS
jgi:hypothetical protein